MYYNGRAWVEDSDDYGFTPRAKEIAAAGVFPNWYMANLFDVCLYLHPIGKITVRQIGVKAADVYYQVSLEFYGADVNIAAPFYTLQAAKMAGLNKMEGLLFDTHQNILAGINLSPEEEEQAGFRGEVTTWVGIVGKDLETLDINGGRFVDRQPFDRSEEPETAQADKQTGQELQGPK